MRVAVSVFNDRISPVFDVSRQIRILEVEKGRIVNEEINIYSDENPHRKVARLRDLNVKTLICGAVSRPLEQMLKDSGIHIIGFIAGSVDDVIKAFLTEEMPKAALMMPGCRRRQNRTGQLFPPPETGGLQKQARGGYQGSNQKEKPKMGRRNGRKNSGGTGAMGGRGRCGQGRSQGCKQKKGPGNMNDLGKAGKGRGPGLRTAATRKQGQANRNQ